MCAYRLFIAIETENVLDILEASNYVNDEFLKNRCFDFILCHKGEIVFTHQFKQMIQTNPSVAIGIILKK